MRVGKLALITPVMMLTEGRWVAMTAWMPTARASWAIRAREVSTSALAVIMMSANSSMMTTMKGSRSGMGSPSSSRTGSSEVPRELKLAMLRTPTLERTWYRHSIWLISQRSAIGTFLVSVTTGVTRWGSEL